MIPLISTGYSSFLRKRESRIQGRDGCPLVQVVCVKFSKLVMVRVGGSFKSLEQHPFVRSEMTILSSRPACWQSAARSGSQGCRRGSGGTGGAGAQRPPLSRGQALDRASTVLG